MLVSNLSLEGVGRTFRDDVRRNRRSPELAATVVLQLSTAYMYNGAVVHIQYLLEPRFSRGAPRPVGRSLPHKPINTRRILGTRRVNKIRLCPRGLHRTRMKTLVPRAEAFRAWRPKEGGHRFFYAPLRSLGRFASCRRDSGIKSDCKRQPASDEHGHRVEHSIRRMWGGDVEPMNV